MQAALPSKLLLSLTLLILLTSYTYGGETEYTVQPGDTLHKIAREQLGDESKWKEIAEANDIVPPYTLKSGQKLKLREHTTTTKTNMQNEIQVKRTTIIDLKNYVLKSLWRWIVVGVLAIWLLGSLCIKAGCWFSLVDASFLRCLLCAMAIAATFGFFLAVEGGNFYLAVKYSWRPLTLILTSILLIIGYLLSTFLITKRILDCKKRSVVTVWVMSTTISNILTSLIVTAIHFIWPFFLGIPKITDMIKNF